MEEFPASYNEFVTDVYIASFMSNKYIPFDDFSGFYKNAKEVSIFHVKDLNLFLNKYDSIKVFGLTQDELIELKQKKLRMNSLKVQSTVLKFDKEFFELSGQKHEKVRRYRNYYTKKMIISVSDKLHSPDDLDKFLNEWKHLRKHAHYTMFTGYDKNFFSNYLEQFKDRIICQCFYYKNKLIGYILLEKVNKHLYNLLHRKANTSYPNLCLYIDYYGFKSIFEETGETFYVNLGSDIGEYGMNLYKTQSFHVQRKVYDLIDVKIFKE